MHTINKNLPFVGIVPVGSKMWGAVNYMSLWLSVGSKHDRDHFSFSCKREHYLYPTLEIMKFGMVVIILVSHLYFHFVLLPQLGNS